MKDRGACGTGLGGWIEGMSGMKRWDVIVRGMVKRLEKIGDCVEVNWEGEWGSKEG